MNLILPDFESFKPKKLENLAQKVEHGVYEFKPIKINIDLIIKKLKNGIDLTAYEVVGIINEQTLLIDNGLISEFYQQVYNLCKDINIRKKRSLLNQVIFQFGNYYYVKDIYKNINKICSAYEDDIIKANVLRPMGDTWIETKEALVQLINNKNIEIILEEPNYLSIEILIEFIGMRNKHEMAIGFISERLPQFSDFMSSVLIDAFLYSIKSESINNLKQYNYDFFRVIKERFDIPKTKPMFWKKISLQGIKTYGRWLLLDKLFEYFDGLEVSRGERLDFWKMYFDYFTELEFFRKYDQCLVIETENHTFIEFGGPTGGRCFVYDKSYININSIKAESIKRSKTYMISNVLKDITHSKTAMIHSSGWQRNFKREMSRLEYYAR
jgi:hypothetical protein